MAYLDHCVVLGVCPAFALEDVLERKSIAMSCVARRALAASFSFWAGDGARWTRGKVEGCKPCIEVIASGLSFVVQVYT